MFGERESWAWYSANTLWREVRLPICGGDGRLNPALRAELQEGDLLGAEVVAEVIASTAAVNGRRLDELRPQPSSGVCETAYWLAEDAVRTLQWRWPGWLSVLWSLELARVRVLAKRLLVKDAERNGGRAGPTRVVIALARFDISRSDRFVQRMLNALRHAGRRV